MFFTEGQSQRNHRRRQAGGFEQSIEFRGVADRARVCRCESQLDRRLEAHRTGANRGRVTGGPATRYARRLDAPFAPGPGLRVQLSQTRKFVLRCGEGAARR